MEKDRPFLEAKEEILDLLELMEERIAEYVDLGMLDEDAVLYNKVVALFERAADSHSKADLEEVVAVAKEIERHIDAWGNLHGSTTFSLTWPSLEDVE